MSNYRVTYRVGDDTKEIVLSDVYWITYSPEVGPNFRAFWGARKWIDQIAQFKDVVAVIPTERGRDEEGMAL